MAKEDFLASIPIIGGLFDDSEEKALAEIRKKQGIFDAVSLPNISWQNFTPEELEVLGTYSPESAEASSISDDPAMRAAQQNVLERLAYLGNEGFTEIDKAGIQQARDAAARDARANREATMANAQARGVGGSGLEFALREIGSQEAANRAQKAGVDVAAEGARNRALYTQAYGNALSGVRDQDYRTQARNAEAIDRFNMMNTGARNDAARWNIENRQGIYNQNVGNRNQAYLTNQEGRNRVAQDRFGNEMMRSDRRAGIHDDIAAAHWARNERNAKRRAAAGSAIGAGIGWVAGGPEGARMGSDIGGGIGGAY